MGKNIILCSDGTGNTGNKLKGTNVYKIYRAIDRSSSGIHQIVFYDKGVGTQSSKAVRIMSGITGLGFTKNICSLYTFLVNNYEPGDSLFLFGFSRGAYTVRVLSGLINRCGLLDGDRYQGHSGLQKAVRAILRANKRIAKIGPLDTEDKKRLAGIIRAGLSTRHPIPIEMIGVWDTVSAIGAPIYEIAKFFERFTWFRFRNRVLAGNVSNAYQALAIDDERLTFHPELWNEKEKDKNQNIEQVWFSGVHSNVGGGYERDEISLLSLTWMMNRAEKNGLRVSPGTYQQIVSESDPDGRLYDSRAGWGAYYRFLPRDIGKLASEYLEGNAKIHHSVLNRICHFTQIYAPGNLPEQMDPVVSNSNPTEIEKKEIASLQSKLNSGIISRLTKQAQAKPWIKARGIVQRGLIISTICLVGTYLAFLIIKPAVPKVENAVVEKLASEVGKITASGEYSILDQVTDFFATWPLPSFGFLALSVILWALTWPFRWKTEKFHQEAWGDYRKAKP